MPSLCYTLQLCQAWGCMGAHEGFLNWCSWGTGPGFCIYWIVLVEATRGVMSSIITTLPGCTSRATSRVSRMGEHLVQKVEIQVQNCGDPQPRLS